MSVLEKETLTWCHIINYEDELIRARKNKKIIVAIGHRNVIIMTKSLGISLPYSRFFLKTTKKLPVF